MFPFQYGILKAVLVQHQQTNRPEEAGHRSNSFQLNHSQHSSRAAPVSGTVSYSNPYPHPHQHHHFPYSSSSQQRHSDLSNLSFVYLKKTLSGSSSFQNKINLYSNNRLTADSPTESETQNAESTTLSTMASNGDSTSRSNQVAQHAYKENMCESGKRTVSNHLNAANINRFIGPKLAISASSTSTCCLANAGVSNGGLHKPPLPHSKSSFSKF